MKRLGALSVIACVALALFAGRASAHVFAPEILRLTEVAPEQYELEAPEAAAARLLPPPGCQPREQRWDCRAGGLRGRELLVTKGSAETLLIVTFLDGTQESSVFPEEGGSLRLAATAGARRPARELGARYLRLGVWHIATGVDHLLFVAALVLLLRGRRLLRTLTAFTVGHSLTLAAAGLALIALPPPPVEVLIALSVVFLARELVAPREDSLTLRHPTLIAAGFGLLHGLGFAGALGELGLPAGQVPLALLSFNVGVELGQALWVLLLLLPLVATRRLERLRAGRLWPCAYPIGAFAFALAVERLAAML